MEDLLDDIAVALEERPAFYHLLARLYFKPLSREQIDGIARMDFSVYEGVNEHFDAGVNDVRRYLRRVHSGTKQELAIDFTASFGGMSTWQGRYATPYESVFTSSEGLLYQESYHEVYRLYRENGVELAEGYDFPDDHLSFMFEFLAIMSDRAAEALREGDAARALEIVRASRGFLADHVESWYDAMAEVALLLFKTRFYRGVVEITRGWVAFDGQVLDDIAADLAQAVDRGTETGAAASSAIADSAAVVEFAADADDSQPAKA